MFRDTTSSEPNMNHVVDNPVPPLTARTADGKAYKRFADVEAEIRDVCNGPPSGWLARREKLKSETLVFLVRKAGLADDYIRGLLLAELVVRTVRIAESEVKGFDEVATEEIGAEVEAKVFELVWSDATSAQTEFLEIAFAEKVRGLTRNVIERYKKSVMARRDQLDVWTDAEAKGSFEVELRHHPIDPRPNPEELLLLHEDEARREELLQRIPAAVKDPRHFQALYLFHAEDRSLSEIAAHFNSTIREVRYWKETAMHQIRVALGIATEEQRQALRQRVRNSPAIAGRGSPLNINL